MIAEYLQLTRRIKLAGIGDAPDNAKLITFESGTPYRHFLTWVHVTGSGVVNVAAQPMFAGINDGASTVFSAVGAQKVKQVDYEEIRPATRGIHKHMDDQSPPTILKSELQLTNAGADPVIVSIYMLAAATPGGA